MCTGAWVGGVRRGLCMQGLCAQGSWLCVWAWCCLVLGLLFVGFGLVGAMWLIWVTLGCGGGAGHGGSDGALAPGVVVVWLVPLCWLCSLLW